VHALTGMIRTRTVPGTHQTISGILERNGTRIPGTGSICPTYLLGPTWYSSTIP